MKRKNGAVAALICLSVMCIVSITACGRNARLQDVDSITEVVDANISSITRKGEAQTLWIEDYDWSSVSNTGKTPLLADKVSMPVSIEELLAEYPVAEVVTTRSDSEIVRPATDVLRSKATVEAAGAIYLYAEDDAFDKFSASDADIEILIPVGTDMTVSELLANDMWCVLGNAFSVDEAAEAREYEYTYKETAEILNQFIRTHGAPDAVTNAYCEPGAGSYVLVWSVGDAAYGVYVKDAHYKTGSEETRILMIASADYYAPAYFETMGEVDDAYFDLVTLDEFIESLHAD